jgi:hypothetical protein
MDTITKGDPVRCGDVEIVPIQRRSRRDFRIGPVVFTQWTIEPLGVQVFDAGEIYALDLDGNRSDDLLRY